MRKLKLDPARLAVESFDVPAPEEARGTVRARSNTHNDDYTCAFSCKDSGDVMCDATLCDPSCVLHATC